MADVPALDLPLLWSRAILGVGLVVSASEQWYLRREFGPGGLFDWRILRLSHPFWIRRFRAGLFDALFSATGTRGLLVAQFACGVVLLLPVSGLAHAMAMWSAALLLAAMAARMPYGRDGSDQMAFILCVSLALAYSSANPTFRLVCAAFATCQLLLSYLVSGVAKACGPDWRSGQALVSVMKTSTYGHPAVARILETRPALTRAAAHTLIAGELLLAGLVFLPSPLFEIGIVCGIGFHLGTAVVMGLTTFFWAFVAAYPVAIAVSRFMMS